MKVFKDEHGNSWVARASEEETPRHHGTWYLTIHSENDPSKVYEFQTIRWQTASSAARILETISDFELRRRLKSAQMQETGDPVPFEVAENKAPRQATNVNAG